MEADNGAYYPNLKYQPSLYTDKKEYLYTITNSIAVISVAGATYSYKELDKHNMPVENGIQALKEVFNEGSWGAERQGHALC